MSELGKVLVSIAVVLVCIALFIGTYLLNKHTKVPEGCEDKSQHCEGCSLLSCSHNPAHKDEKKEENKDEKSLDDSSLSQENKEEKKEGEKEHD